MIYKTMMREIWTPLPRVVRFVIVGGVNTGFGYLCYAAAVFVGLHYSVAALVGTVLGVIFNYFTSGRLVFNFYSCRALPSFILVYALQYILGIAGLHLLVLAGSNPYMAGIFMIVPMAVVSYLLLKNCVFH